MNPSFHYELNTGRTQKRHYRFRGSLVTLDTREMTYREKGVRWMLSQWVSELEPAILYGPGRTPEGRPRITGLTIVGIPLGTKAPVVVEWPWGFRQ